MADKAVNCHVGYSFNESMQSVLLKLTQITYSVGASL